MVKKRYLVIAAAILTGGGLALLRPADVRADGNGIEINEENFPDDTFRSYVEQFDTSGDLYVSYWGDEDPAPEYDPESPDFNSDDWYVEEQGDGYLSDEELAAVTEMDLSNSGYWGGGCKVESFKGIEYFTELRSLDCNGLYELSNTETSGVLTDLDLSKNTKLEYLNCSGNTSLETLDLCNNPALITLDCSYCGSLSEVDVSHNANLEELSCGGRLKELYSNSWYGSDTRITGISAAVKLKSLKVNSLKGIDLSELTELTTLIFDGGSNNSFWYTEREGYVLDLRSNAKLNHIDIGTYYGAVREYVSDLYLPEREEAPDSGEPPYFRVYGPGFVDLRRFALGDAEIEETSTILIRTDDDLGWQDGTKDMYYGYEQKRYIEETGETPATLRFASGLTEIDDKSYYFGDDNCCICNDIAEVDGVKMYFDKDGIRQDALPSEICVGSYHFPDKQFRGWVCTKADKDKDGFLSDSEIRAITVFRGYFSGAGSSGGGDGYTEVYDGWDHGMIYSGFKGIEFFTELKVFDYYDSSFSGGYEGNYLPQVWSSLDLSKNTKLETVYLQGAIRLENGIDVSGCSNLKYLTLQIGELDSLDLSRNTKLLWLDVGRADLTMTGPCNNNLKELDLSQNPALEFLDISFNPITSVDVSMLTSLVELHCEGMGMEYGPGSAWGQGVSGKGTLKSLDLSKNTELVSLWCGLNQLTELDTSKNPKLKYLSCAYNDLKTLDLSNNPELAVLNCYGNSITRLDISETALAGEAATHEASLNTFAGEAALGDDCFYAGPFFYDYELDSDGNRIKDENGDYVTHIRPLNTDQDVTILCDLTPGWVKKADGWKYVTADKVYAVSWQKISGKWYYFNASGAMLTGWQKISGKWYYFNTSGAMLTGWQKISGKWYYLKSGVMQTGWLKISGKWYYFNTSGVMLSGTSKVIGGKTYTFDQNGVCTNP